MRGQPGRRRPPHRKGRPRQRHVRADHPVLRLVPAAATAADRRAATATDRESSVPFLFTSPAASSRTARRAWAARPGPARPTDTSCQSSRWPVPPAPSTAHVRCADQGTGQGSSRMRGDASAATVDAVGERRPITIDQAHPSLHVRSTVHDCHQPRSSSSPPPRRSLTPPRNRRSCTSWRRPTPARCSTTCRPRPVDKLPVDEEWITVPAAVGRRPRAHRQAAGRDRHAAGHRLHARRRLDPRQRRHPRPARARARRRRPRGGRVRRVPALAGGALPGRDRAGLRHRPVDHPRRARPRAWTPAGWPSPASRSAAT